MGDVRVSEDAVTQVVQTAVVRPGDKLIVRVSQGTPAAEAGRLREALSEALPDVAVLMVGGIEEMAIYRPEPPRNIVLNVDDLSKAVADNMQRRAGLQRRRTG